MSMEKRKEVIAEEKKDSREGRKIVRPRLISAEKIKRRQERFGVLDNNEVKGQKRKQYDDPTLPEEKRNKIMEYTQEELKERKRHFGSTLSIIDRRKFDREFDVRSLKLNDDLKAIWDNNSHLRQVFANKKEFKRGSEQLNGSDRVVSPESGRTQYQRRQGEAKTVEHWGQRKLLLSEIEFLSNYGGMGSKTIVYAGAAPGNHVEFLESLFPNKFKWVLVDPAKFAARETKNIKIINDYFTDELAERFVGKDVLFICDIRSMDHKMSEKEKEERVQVDMQSQQRWHKIMNPAASMLKFRLPYAKGYTEYLDGLIYFQAWAGRTSSETRLVVTREDGNKVKKYSHQDYEDLMYHYNTETRTTYWPHDIHSRSLDHCYDCAAEILLKVQEDELQKATIALSDRISSCISNTGRKLSM